MGHGRCLPRLPERIVPDASRREDWSATSAQHRLDESCLARAGRASHVYESALPHAPASAEPERGTMMTTTTARPPTAGRASAKSFTANYLNSTAKMYTTLGFQKRLIDCLQDEFLIFG